MRIEDISRERLESIAGQMADLLTHHDSIHIARINGYFNVTDEEIGAVIEAYDGCSSLHLEQHFAKPAMLRLVENARYAQHIADKINDRAVVEVLDNIWSDTHAIVFNIADSEGWHREAQEAMCKADKNYAASPLFYAKSIGGMAKAASEQATQQANPDLNHYDFDR